MMFRERQMISKIRTHLEIGFDSVCYDVLPNRHCKPKRHRKPSRTLTIEHDPVQLLLSCTLGNENTARGHNASNNCNELIAEASAGTSSCGDVRKRVIVINRNELKECNFRHIIKPPPLKVTQSEERRIISHERSRTNY